MIQLQTFFFCLLSFICILVLFLYLPPLSFPGPSILLPTLPCGCVAGAAGFILFIAVLPTVTCMGGWKSVKGRDGEGDTGVEARINKDTPPLLPATITARDQRREHQGSDS